MRLLKHHPFCPYARKVRLALAEKKLDFTLERALSANASELNVWPSFVDLNGAIIAHHGSICEYLEELYQTHPLLPSDPLARAEVRRIAGWFDDTFGRDVTGPLLFEKYGKRLAKQGAPDSSVIRKTKMCVASLFDQLQTVIDRRHWLASDEVSYADLAGAAHISIVDYLGDVPWDKYPIIKDWYVRLKSRPSFRPILLDRIPSLPPAEDYDNLDF